MNEIQLRQIVITIQNIDTKVYNLILFHVLCKNNVEADQVANRSVGLEPRTLLLNDHELGWDPLS